MLILVNGLPHFSKKIVADLNEIDPGNRYVFCNTYDSKIAQLKYLMLLPFCKVVLSFNGVTDPSRSLNWAVMLRKKMIMQWHGTDVMLAQERFKNQTIFRKYIDYANHLVSAPWFLKSLEGIVKDATYAPFGYVQEAGNSNSYDTISVLAYISEGREEFYGWNELAALAEANEGLEIHVVGTRGNGLRAPKNVRFLGWVNEQELLNEMRKSAIFIRLTEHDGKAISVAQALSTGAEVIWTYEYSMCHTIQKSASELRQKVAEVSALIEQRGMRPNERNIEFSKEHLLKDQVLQNYLSVFKTKLNE